MIQAIAKPAQVTTTFAVIVSRGGEDETFVLDQFFKLEEAVDLANWASGFTIVRVEKWQHLRGRNKGNTRTKFRRLVGEEMESVIKPDVRMPAGGER